jgi:microsomal dipeptidase-like Zn-dependent dipeptidase
MNRLGIIVDVSHVHERTFWDVVRVAARPFIASHSNAAALCPVGRNLTDDQLRAVAAFPTVGASLPGLFREMEDGGQEVGRR